MEETTDLLQHLIRNACVNEGTVASGGEVRNVDTLMAYLEAPGVEMKRYEPEPGRGSFVLRIEGSDKKAPSLLFMGHADVVPANPAGWRHDPFGGELIDGVVWGRGAVDMLNVTASMAVAVRRLIDKIGRASCRERVDSSEREGSLNKKRERQMRRASR